MDRVDLKVEELISAMKESQEYQRYCAAEKKLRQYPTIEQQVNEFRKKNYEIQKQKQSHNIYDELMHLQSEYATLRRNPLVDEYLSAEMALCRCIQDINRKMIRDLEFYIGFEDDK